MIHSFVCILSLRAFLTMLKYNRLGGGQLVRRRRRLSAAMNNPHHPPIYPPSLVESSSSKRNPFSPIKTWLNTAPSSDNGLMRGGRQRSSTSRVHRHQRGRLNETMIPIISLLLRKRCVNNHTHRIYESHRCEKTSTP
jgi:hypothetical protein